MTETTFVGLHIGAIFEFVNPGDYSGHSTFPEERQGRFVKVGKLHYLHATRAGADFPKYPLMDHVRVRRLDLDDLGKGERLSF